jgi:aminopeptidase N
VGFESIPHNLGKTWFPCIDDFQDRAYYDVYATVENGKDAVCGGLLVDVINNGNGTSTYHWALGNTIPTYLASIAVGDYAKWSGTFNGMSGAIPIEIWVKPNDSSKVAGSFEHLNQILTIFENRFGPYRWERIGYVGTSIGAMEHATNIAYPHFAIDGGLSYESLFTHELSHMWFGDNVTCASAEDMWLNEGWAVFCEAIYREFLYSKEEYIEYLSDTHAEVLQKCHTPSGDGSYFPLNQIPQEVTYGMSAYRKGATVAHSLRGYLGDVVFFDAITAYQETFKYNYASSEDFRDFLTSQTGIDMNDWFDSWVLTQGTPHFSVDSFAVVSYPESADVTVYMKQKRKGSDFMGNSNIVDLTFMDEEWNVFVEQIQFSGETGSSIIQVPFTPSVVMVDLEIKQLDATTEYTHVISEADNYDYHDTFFDLEVHEVSDSALVRMEHNWVPPDTMFNPIEGLTISDYRYWKLDGIIPETFSATGKFWYNKNGYLDNTLLVDPADSVIIMYREGPHHDWQYIDFTRIGNWDIGYFYIDNVQLGQYTIAVCDDVLFSSINEPTVDLPSNLKIYPNPSSGEFNIESDRAGSLRIYNANGVIVDTILLPKQMEIQWTPPNLPEGSYFARLLSDRNQTIAVERIIIIK